MFGKGYKLFNLLGFEVSIDPSWVLLAILVAWSLSTSFFPFQVGGLSSGTYWMMGGVGALGLFLSIIAHEFAHSLVARSRGVPMKGITLFIFGGVAQMDAEPGSAGDEFRIAVVGPLASIAVGAVFYGLYHLGPSLGWTRPVAGVLGYLAAINWLLAVFNLLPAFPLDGGRILRSILWRIKGNLRWATRISSQVGTGFGLLLIVLGVMRVLVGNLVGGMWLFLIGLFIQNAARMSYQQLVVRKALEGENLRRFMKTDPVTVTSDVTVQDLVDDYILGHHHKLLPVVDHDRLTGCVAMRQVKRIPREEWPHRTVGDLAEACSDENTIAPDVDVVQALAQMRRNASSRVMVVENGRLIGVVALKDLLEFLSLKVELDP